jgi:transcriptional regulator with PAS, ATPase and Fis domain
MEIARGYEDATEPHVAPPALGALRGLHPPSALIGESEAMREVRSQVELAAKTDLPVLIEGETGSGKEIVAHEIHLRSRRAAKPLVIVDCLTIPDTLLESELFGHNKGAFTGATDRREGRLQEADGGTLFFDEIGSVGLPVQAKLLRFLETGQYPRVGEKGMRRVDGRILAATSHLLGEGIGDGRIRKDFYYRLSALYVWVPPLRERKADIPLLVDHFLRGAGIRGGVSRLGPRALRTLLAHDWPGNVRELKNTILANLVRSDGGEIADVRLGRNPLQASPRTPSQRSLRGFIREQEREFLAQLVEENGDSLGAMAVAADVSVRTLQRKLRYHRLRR